MYKVFDTCGEPLRYEFTSPSTAYSFIAMMGRTGDWKVKEVKQFKQLFR